MGFPGIFPVKLQNFLFLLRLCVGQAGFVTVGTDILGTGRIHHGFIAVTKAHFVIKGRVKRVQRTHGSARLCEKSQPYADEIFGDVLFLVEKAGGQISRSAHLHPLPRTFTSKSMRREEPIRFPLSSKQPR